MKNQQKTTLYIAAVIVLFGIAVLFYLKDEKSTLDPALSDFALENGNKTDSIVIMQDSQTTTLSLRNKTWYLNSQFPARQEAVKHLFNVMEQLRVESPAAESSKENILELLNENPIHIKVFENGKKIKDYLVEDSQYKKGSTYMMISGSDEPFLMNLPGHDGDIATLYRSDPNYWRNNFIFNYSGTDLSQVKVIYPEDIDESFILNYNRRDQFVLEKAGNNEKIEGISSSQAARYLSYFSNIRFESIIEDKRLFDSLKNSTPYCTIQTTDLNGKTKQVETYRKLADKEQDAFGQNSYYDLNYLYALYDPFGEILLIKYTEIDPLFKEIDYFRVE